MACIGGGAVKRDAGQCNLHVHRIRCGQVMCSQLGFIGSGAAVFVRHAPSDSICLCLTKMVGEMIFELHGEILAPYVLNLNFYDAP